MDIYSDKSWWVDGIPHNQPITASNCSQADLNTGVPQFSGFPGRNGQTPPCEMPIPLGGPWNMNGMPWGKPSPHPSLMQFTAQPTEVAGTNTFLEALHAKRKSELDEIIPAKQHISEDKMAAHLSGLHISTDYTSHRLCSPEATVAMISCSAGSERLCGGGLGSPDLSERLKTAQKIILCEEMKKLHDQPLIPPTLLSRLEKPCMSLVLWKPPERILLNPDSRESNNNNSESVDSSSETSARKRQGILVPDYAMEQGNHTYEDSGSMDVEM